MTLEYGYFRSHSRTFKVIDASTWHPYNTLLCFCRLKIPSRKKLKPAVVFEAQSCSTHGPIKVEKFFQKCEVCDLYVNSKRQWEIHISGKEPV